MPVSPNKAQYFLLLIDIFSQKLFIKVLADKQSVTIAKALGDILKENPFPLGQQCSSISSDYGLEFFGKTAAMLRKKGIKQYMFRGLSKAQVCYTTIHYYCTRYLFEFL